jgi:hypothetical protein
MQTILEKITDPGSTGEQGKAYIVVLLRVPTRKLQDAAHFVFFTIFYRALACECARQGVTLIKESPENALNLRGLVLWLGVVEQAQATNAAEACFRAVHELWVAPYCQIAHLTSGDDKTKWQRDHCGEFCRKVDFEELIVSAWIQPKSREHAEIRAAQISELFEYLAEMITGGGDKPNATGDES